jgi:hypothetical protein
MKPPRYANANPSGGDTNNIVSNDIELYLSNNIELYKTNNIELITNDIVSNDIVSSNIVRKRAREEIVKTLGRMTPAYRAAVKRNQEDPLAYRIEKMMRRLRPMVGSDRFMEITQEFVDLEPVEQAKLCQAFEVWIEKSATEGA